MTLPVMKANTNRNDFARHRPESQTETHLPNMDLYLHLARIQTLYNAIK